MTIKEWWESLESREKQAVLLGGVCVSIFIVYAAIWSPLMTSVATMRSHIQSQERNLTWMKQADVEVQKLEGQSSHTQTSSSPVVILSALQSQVNQSGLEQYMTQLKQTSNDVIAMSFTNVPFDKVVTLLTTVLKQSHITVTQMSVLAEATPGIVNVDIQFKSK